MTKTLHYKSFSINYDHRGQGPCLVFLHGFCENLTIWEPYINAFQEHYTVIAIDLPGHGQSQVTDVIHTMDEMAAIVKDILTAENIEKACIIGHSMGGYVGLAFAAVFPQAISGLCLLHSTAYPDSEEKKQDRMRAVSVVNKNKGAYINALIPGLFNPDNLHLYQDKVAWLTDMGLQTPTAGITAALAGMSTRPERVSVLQQASFPISFIIGKHDGILPMEKLMTLTTLPKHPQINVLEHAGHAGFVEAPLECLRAITQLADSLQS